MPPVSNNRLCVQHVASWQRLVVLCAAFGACAVVPSSIHNHDLRHLMQARTVRMWAWSAAAMIQGSRPRVRCALGPGDAVLSFGHCIRPAPLQRCSALPVAVELQLEGGTGTSGRLLIKYSDKWGSVSFGLYQACCM